jgi:hypothetical protein
MALFQWKCYCSKCDLTYLLNKPHIHLSDRNHDDDPVKKELRNQAHPKRPGDLCYCGGNPDHVRCGGTGRIIS